MDIDGENREYKDCGVRADEFPFMGKCCCKKEKLALNTFEKICLWCSIWTSLPDGASLKTATIFECVRLGYVRRIKE